MQTHRHTQMKAIVRIVATLSVNTLIQFLTHCSLNLFFSCSDIYCFKSDRKSIAMVDAHVRQLDRAICGSGALLFACRAAALSVYVALR